VVVPEIVTNKLLLATACVGTVPQARSTSVIAPEVPDEAVTVALPKSFSVILSTSAYNPLTLSSHTLLS